MGMNTLELYRCVLRDRGHSALGDTELRMHDSSVNGVVLCAVCILY